MASNGPTTPVDRVLDAGVVLGSLAGALVEGADLSDALRILVGGLGLRSAAVRSAAGDLIGVGGDAVRALSSPVVEVEVPLLDGAPATLTVTGARPSQLDTLRSAASILGLALGRGRGVDLLDLAEQDRDTLADALHDGPVQTLVAARLTCDLAVRGGDVKLARDAVQEALVQLRRQLWQIRPRGVAGLDSALEQLSAQRIAAGQPALSLLLETDVDGAAAVLAYRLVQAVSAEGGPVSVAVRAVGELAHIDVDSVQHLPSPERWVRRARALGGDLSSSAGRLRLVLPLHLDPRTT